MAAEDEDRHAVVVVTAPATRRLECPRPATTAPVAMSSSKSWPLTPAGRPTPSWSAVGDSAARAPRGKIWAGLAGFPSRPALIQRHLAPRTVASRSPHAWPAPSRSDGAHRPAKAPDCSPPRFERNRRRAFQRHHHALPPIHEHSRLAAQAGGIPSPSQTLPESERWRCAGNRTFVGGCHRPLALAGAVAGRETGRQALSNAGLTGAGSSYTASSAGASATAP
jgi:hypothetical protein